jgi:hypothetical protein
MAVPEERDGATACPLAGAHARQWLSMPPSSGRAVVLYTGVRAVSDPLADERPCNSGHGSGEVEIPGRSLRFLSLFIARVRFFPCADPFYIRVSVPCSLSIRFDRFG